MSLEKFYSMRASMDTAFDKEDVSLAERIAYEYLDLAKSFEGNWNYGNAIHHSNLVLGRVALENGDLIKAKNHLISAGKTTGSPQLNSFGPNMLLAKELLEIGEKDIVIEYINLTRRFWMHIYSGEKIQRWKKEILQDLVPDFAANLMY